ncbi:MAG: FAD-binding oxidoreductase [Bacillota bacterium]|nr:FAD-binding oxidoreductase [Bacillota bacterium]
MPLIKPMSEDLSEFLRDESRNSGHADTISFPACEDDIIAILRELHDRHTRVTIQGGRTGLAAAAVPDGGHILNLSRCNKLLAMREQNGRFYLTVQPGLVLSQLRKALETRKLDVSAFDTESLAACHAFATAGGQFFSPDPTETSAMLGGMVACNASGARSYFYGATREHISALRVVLANGETLTLRRGQLFAAGRRLTLHTEQGGRYDLTLPTYRMPAAKNASGYYIADNMDAIDLFIGSDGTLGVISEIELELLPLPAKIWALTCFFGQWQQAADFVGQLRAALPRQSSPIAAIEYFDSGALEILRKQKQLSGVFGNLLDIDPSYGVAVYLELHCADDEQALRLLRQIGDIATLAGGDMRHSWVARNAGDRERLIFFRHAVPEAVNMLIDRRKANDPAVVKLSTDMSVPDGRLRETMQMYVDTLRDSGLEYATWGHIGDNHLHINILPRDAADCLTGKRLYAEWAARISAAGGAVSAEHGVGKIKAPFLQTMYGRRHIVEMARLKQQLDPYFQLGAGNLFAADILNG